MSDLDTIFGRNLGGNDDIEDAAKATLDKWLWPTYTGAVERFKHLTPGILPEPGAWSTSSFFDAMPGDEFLPLVVIVCTGTSERPLKDGKGTYHAVYQLDIGVVVSEPENPRRLASYMGLAIRGCLNHKQLEGLDAEVDWLGDRSDDLPFEAERSLAAARVQFKVKLRDVMSRGAGPEEPAPTPEDPSGEWAELPRIETSHMRVDQIREEGE